MSKDLLSCKFETLGERTANSSGCRQIRAERMEVGFLAPVAVPGSAGVIGWICVRREGLVIRSS